MTQIYVILFGVHPGGMRKNVGYTTCNLQMILEIMDFSIQHDLNAIFYGQCMQLLIIDSDLNQVTQTLDLYKFITIYDHLEHQYQVERHGIFDLNHQRIESCGKYYAMVDLKAIETWLIQHQVEIKPKPIPFQFISEDGEHYSLQSEMMYNFEDNSEGFPLGVEIKLKSIQPDDCCADIDNNDYCANIDNDCCVDIDNCEKTKQTLNTEISTFNINLTEGLPSVDNGLFDFTNMSFAKSMRLFFSKIHLPKEVSKMDHMIEIFSEQYHKQNMGIFSSADTAYVLAYAVVLLNADAHNPFIKHKMSKKDFYITSRGIDDGKDLDLSMLSKLYDEIVANNITI